MGFEAPAPRARRGYPMEDVYALWREGREPLLLEGDSTPVHTVNVDESLHLDAADAADYIRFFCFAVRGAGGEPFFLCEEPPENVEDDPDGRGWRDITGISLRTVGDG